MSQPTSSSGAGFLPVQLSLFVGEFDVAELDRADQQGIARGSNDALKLSGVESPVSDADLLCSQTIEFMRVFESISGWEVYFQESAASKIQRSQSLSLSDQSLRPQGKFEIIDMSIDWPAKTPTMHRAKCDQLIQLYGNLYNQANATQDSFDKVQGLLSALTETADDSNQLVDSFAPMFTNLVEDGGVDFVAGQGMGSEDEFESAFVVKQDLDSNWLADKNVWSDWTFGGATGIVGDAYLDWDQHGDVLTVYVGRIESSLGSGDAESSLEVNAITRQFKVKKENRLAAFFYWDRRGGFLESVEPGRWRTLHPQGAVIVSTDPNVQMPMSVVNARISAEDFTAEQLAGAIEAQLGIDHRVMVIKCD